MMSGLARAAFALLLILGEAHADERDFTGVVSRIFDGDSFLVRNAAGKNIDVRLIDIDAPEKDQPYGDQARAALMRLIDSRRVFVDVIDIDKYRRKVARVYREPDRLDVARALVHDGNVWVYRRTVRDASLIPLENAARAEHLGLWALPKSDLVPPWRFRYLRRQEGISDATQGAHTPFPFKTCSVPSLPSGDSASSRLNLHPDTPPVVR